MFVNNIHPLIGKVVVSPANSNSTIIADTNHNNKSFIPLSSSSINSSNNTNQNSMNMMMKMMERGNIAMGFNQSKISHHFIATPNGGNIIITALNNSDIQTITQIKNHIKDIQKEFSEGNFTKPFFIHAQKVPGTDIMAEKKNLIKYNVSELKNGSSLMLTTSDKQLIDAIHKFIEFQATAHHGH